MKVMGVPVETKGGDKQDGAKFSQSVYYEVIFRTM